MERLDWPSLSTEVVTGRGNLQCADHEGNFWRKFGNFLDMRLSDGNLFLPDAPMPAR